MEQTNRTNQEDSNLEHRHSKVITGYRTMDEQLHWRYTTKNLFDNEDESIEIRFFFPIRKTPAPQQSDTVRKLLKQMEETEVNWLMPGRKEWLFKFERMKEAFPGLQSLEWCKGDVFVEPEFEVQKEGVDITGAKYYETSVVFYLNPKVLNMTTPSVPPDSQQSLQKL